MEDYDKLKKQKDEIVVQQEDAKILKAIDERDAAQEALARAYYLVTGQVAEWSNAFSYDDALREIENWGECEERELTESDHKLIKSAWEKHVGALAVEELLNGNEVVKWAQATLTALNVGDIKMGSLIHLKLREVLIAYRNAKDQQQSGEMSKGL